MWRLGSDRCLDPGTPVAGACLGRRGPSHRLRDRLPREARRHARRDRRVDRQRRRSRAIFASCCIWADHPRKRDDEHYVNLARDAQAIGADACPLADRCVVTRDREGRRDASSPTANSEVARLIALKFLGHFVGDVHQPMHVSFQDDRGGNSVDTTGICGSNLHSAWDTCLLQQAVGTDVAAAVDQLTGEIVSADTWAWVQSSAGRLGQRIVRDLDRRPDRLLRPGGRHLRVRARQRAVRSRRARSERSRSTRPTSP